MEFAAFVAEVKKQNGRNKESVAKKMCSDEGTSSHKDEKKRVHESGENWRAPKGHRYSNRGHQSGQGQNQQGRSDTNVETLLDIEHRYFSWVHGRLKDDTTSISHPSGFTGARITEALALDCEGVGIGPNSRRNVVGRVSIVNERGECVYDTFVNPMCHVTDYRTWLTGITKKDLESGRDIRRVREDIKKLLHKRKLVGHALHNDFKMLGFTHSEHLTRDTAKYEPLQLLAGNCHPSLKKLAKQVLGINVQDGLHDSVEDARTAMLLYQKHKRVWEESEYGWPELSTHANR